MHPTRGRFVVKSELGSDPILGGRARLNKHLNIFGHHIDMIFTDFEKFRSGQLDPSSLLCLDPLQKKLAVTCELTGSKA